METQEVELSLAPTALLTRCAAQPYAFALDGGSHASWGTGEALLGWRPRATLRVLPSGDATMSDGERMQSWRGDPFALLDRFRAQWCGAGRATVPHAGGILVALSYDLRHWIERLAPRRVAEALPVLHAAYYDWVLAYSYHRRRYEVASSVYSARELRGLAAELRSLAALPSPAPTARAPVRVDTDFTKPRYLAAVQRALDYIAAGDAYQINLAQRFTANSTAAPAMLFAHMQRHPVPFAAYIDGGSFVLVSNSPECFLRLRNREVATCPIKGTRPRGHDPGSDRQLQDELRSSTKDNAEHVMIVDLERNDLGRVCRTGSVRVAESARVHTFPSVHHLVSTVRGDLYPQVSLAELLRATFPGGSITGAPKVRAMQIIDELEPVARGFYTGAMGFIGADGSATFNLTIRTAIAIDGRFTYHAGGGIVADSVPEREYDESLLKATPFFEALEAL